MQHYTNQDNPYKILKVDSSAPIEVIKAAYRALLKAEQLHPDLGGEVDSARRVIEAYEILVDPAKKKDVDHQLKQEETAEILRRTYSERTKHGRDDHPQFAKNHTGGKPKEFYVICLRCRGINKLTDSQSIFHTHCGSCRRPFVNDSGEQAPGDFYKKTPVRSDPNFAKYLYDRKMYVRALDDYVKLIQLEKGNPAHYYMAGMCCYRMMNYRQAVRHYNDSNSINPDSFMVNFYMGKALLKMKNAVDAIPFFEKTVLLNKNHVKARSLLGHTYFQLGRHEKAIPHLIRVIKSKPTTEHAIFTLGIAYLSLNKPLQARVYFKIAKRLFPKFPKIDQMIAKTNTLIHEQSRATP